MIRAYNEHAANERTFLAWVRTGLAVIAFGFVVEKINLFIRGMTVSASAGAAHQPKFEALWEGFRRFDGIALISLGVMLIVVQTARFVRIGRKLDDGAPHSTDNMRSELAFSAALVLLVTAYATYLALV